MLKKSNTECLKNIWENFGKNPQVHLKKHYFQDRDFQWKYDKKKSYQSKVEETLGKVWISSGERWNSEFRRNKRSRKAVRYFQRKPDDILGNIEKIFQEKYAQPAEEKPDEIFGGIRKTIFKENHGSRKSKHSKTSHKGCCIKINFASGILYEWGIKSQSRF